MKNPISIYKRRMIIAGIIVYLLGVAFYTYYEYIESKKTILEKIDTKLHDGAMGAIYILGETYHDRATTLGAISEREDYDNIIKLSRYSEELGLKYVYTMIKKDNRVIFTSSSATKEELNKKEYTKYFDEYPEATDIDKNAFNDFKIAYEESTDKWGSFRTILIPVKSPGGNIYLAGADITLEHIDSILRLSMIKSILVAIFFVLVALPFLGVVLFYMKGEKEFLESEVKERTEEIRELNSNLELRIVREINKNREKDVLIMKQSGLAAMGEMIGNIAHQWRQPINALGLVIQDIQDAYEYEELDQEYIDNSVKKSMSIINFMSQTINDFRTFFKPDKAKEVFNINESIRKTISITEGVYKNYEIEIDYKCEKDLYAIGFANEFSQVILNIMNNAKDILIEKVPENRKIEIRVEEKDKKSIVKIKDNGGGIPENVMGKLFELYFTTKDASKGTGLGLYMSKTIVESNMNGKMYAYNEDGGAVFVIEIPPAVKANT